MIETKSEAKSNFVGYLGIKNYSQIKQNLILPTVQNFFGAREIQDFKAIDEQASFADLDFNRTNFADFFAHFYDFIVNDIQSVGGGEFPLTVTYCITLDETNCSKTCEQTKIRYDEILLYQQPVFYFIYVDVKDIFACLRETGAPIKLPKIELIELIEPEPALIELSVKVEETLLNTNQKPIKKFICENGIATDTKTGLMWLRFAYGQNWWNGRISENYKLLVWEQALSEAKKFNQEGGYAGYNDWRVPTIDELKTLLDNYKNNYDYKTIFPKNSGIFWSCSSVVSNLAYSWIVDFKIGENRQSNKSSEHYVRLVRG